MGWRVEVYRLILNMVQIMGGRRVYYILGICMVCTVGIREQRTRGILYSGRWDLCTIDASVIE